MTGRALDTNLPRVLVAIALAGATVAPASEGSREEPEKHQSHSEHGEGRAPERQLVITFVGADLGQELLFITGRNLGRGPFRVMLGTELLVVDSAGWDWILARLPPDVAPGSYSLRVVRKHRYRRDEARASASFEVTIGAVGPPGPAGETGLPGPPGPPGHLGLAGQACPAGHFVSAFGPDGELVCSSPGGTAAACGNGLIEPGEQCDDGNLTSGDGCDAVCQLEALDVDNDGDGWTGSEGDCCDVPGSGCVTPELVNPGAYDVLGNLVDDDCDGAVDNRVACDEGLASDASDAMLYAAALDLCDSFEEGTSDQRLWGVVSAELSRADGLGAPAPESRSIRARFGSNPARFGSRLVVLSTGSAAAPDDSSPAFQEFQGGRDTGSASDLPGDWLAANGGALPSASGCPAAPDLVAYNPVMLTLRIRTPSNAHSFSLSTKFFSAEYPEWVCNAFNDYHVVLLDSSYAGEPTNPADKNIALYTAPDSSTYPIGVNLAFGNTGLFQACLNGPTGCASGSNPSNTSSCTGTAELQGTGFDIANPPAQFAGGPGWCGSSNLVGGGTAWLKTGGNVVPGETIELRIAVWDTGDPWYDSVVLVDDFEWSVENAVPGTRLH